MTENPTRIRVPSGCPGRALAGEHTQSSLKFDYSSLCVVYVEQQGCQTYRPIRKFLPPLMDWTIGRGKALGNKLLLQPKDLAAERRFIRPLWVSHELFPIPLPPQSTVGKRIWPAPKNNPSPLPFLLFIQRKRRPNMARLGKRARPKLYPRTTSPSYSPPSCSAHSWPHWIRSDIPRLAECFVPDTAFG